MYDGKSRETPYNTHYNILTDGDPDNTPPIYSLIYLIIFSLIQLISINYVTLPNQNVKSKHILILNS